MNVQKKLNYIIYKGASISNVRFRSRKKTTQHRH